MSVAPRWKRRADEIAEAIGDELSINGTVSIGNDVNLSVATITALANAITSVLNPTSIAAAIWLGQEVGTHVATVVAPVAPLTARQYSVTLNGVYQITRSHVFTHDLSSLIAANDYTIGTVFNVLLNSGTTNQYRLLNPTGLTHDVSVVSTNITPVHVQVRNLASGFTAMATDISQAMKLSAQPVSIADTVNVKTDTGDSVAITGTVNASVGSATFPISNPNNITVPVRATSTGIPQNASGVSVICPVNVGSSTVPVKATTAGIPQNANGISLYLPVDANHGLTIPVGGGVSSIPVGSTGLTSIPVSNPNNVSVLVENTNSVVVPVRTVTGTTNAAGATGAAVVVPVTSSGTILDVNIKTIEASAKTQFHEAVETALNDATNIDTFTHDLNIGKVHWYSAATPQTSNSWIINVAGVENYGQTLFVAGTGHLMPSLSPASAGFVSAYVGRPVHRVSGTVWSFSALESGATHGAITSVATQIETAVTNALNNADDIDVDSNLDDMTGYIWNYIGTTNTTYQITTRGNSAVNSIVYSDATFTTLVNGSSHVNKLVSRLHRSGPWYIH